MSGPPDMLIRILLSMGRDLSWIEQMEANVPGFIVISSAEKSFLGICSSSMLLLLLMGLENMASFLHLL